MKPLIPIIGAAVCLVAASASAQGTINFANRITGSIDAKVINPMTGLGCSGADGFFSQLYVSATPDGSFTAVGSPVAFRSDAGIGYVVASVVTTHLPGGSTAFVYMASWMGAPTYEAAGFFKARSNTIQVVLGNPSATPPTTPAILTGLQGYVVPVPEPTQTALLALGAATALMIRGSRRHVSSETRSI